jgi:beta-N-acetylhexosaminidase
MIPLLEELKKSGKPIVVLSNTPYPKFGVPEWVDTALVTFCASGKENLSVAADILFGKRKPVAKLPFASK